MTHPVSVQICTINEAGNLADCLDTVTMNDPAEIVIIDGGSTDNTLEIAADYGCRVIEAGRIGLGPSRQAGYRSTAEPYVAFVDADDRLSRAWLGTMLAELQEGGYSALQSRLRSADTSSFWGRGWDQYFLESVRPTADTTIVGRPALFRTSDLLRDDEDLISLDEDTHLSRRFELLGLRQGIGTAVAYRHCEDSWSENSRKWQSYGRGYRGFVAEHPERRAALLRHVAVTIPLERGWRPVLRGAWWQPGFTALMASNVAWGWMRSSGSLETPKASQGS